MGVQGEQKKRVIFVSYNRSGLGIPERLWLENIKAQRYMHLFVYATFGDFVVVEVVGIGPQSPVRARKQRLEYRVLFRGILVFGVGLALRVTTGSP